MPAPGDQHRGTSATTNPFIDHRHHMTGYTAAEIATLQSRLDKQLGPEYVSTRPGNGGGKVHYLAAEKAINLANEVFGFNGWSSSIQNVQIDFVDEHPQTGKISLGLSTIVRVTIRDGTFHEDMGYGHIENCKGKAAAFEKAKKEAVTDAMKRALRNFGNVLGNCLYDKDYLSKVQKVKIQPSRWDADKNLHRHPDFAPVKLEAAGQGLLRSGGGQEVVKSGMGQQRQISAQSAASFGSIEFDDEFGANALDETDFDHPDQIRLDDTPMETPARQPVFGGDAQQRDSAQRMPPVAPMRPPNVHPPTPMQAPQAPQRPQAPPRPSHTTAQPPTTRVLQQAPPQNQHQRPASGPPAPQPNHPQRQANGLPAQAQNQQNQQPHQQHQQNESNGPKSNHSSAGMATDGAMDNHATDDAPPPVPPPGAPDGFVSGRSADIYTAPLGVKPSEAPRLFNPHAEATSIRRTPGMNPGVSAKVMRSSIMPQNPQPQASNAQANAAQQNQHRPQSPALLHAQGNQPQPTNGFSTAANSPARINVVNPAAESNRRIGMPPAGGMLNRTGFKPHSAVTGGGVKRPPLTDVSNLQAQQMDGGSEVKRAKLDHDDSRQPEKTAQEGVVQTGHEADGSVVSAS